MLLLLPSPSLGWISCTLPGGAGLDPTPGSSCQVGFSCPEGSPCFPDLEQVSKWSDTEPEAWLPMPHGKDLGRCVSCSCFPAFPSQVCGNPVAFWSSFPAWSHQPGLLPISPEHSTSTSEAVITILIFTIRACGLPLYQKEFPVNEVLITESCINGGGENSSLSLVQPQAAVAWPAQR